jgi:hypothetical protein
VNDHELDAMRYALTAPKEPDDPMRAFWQWTMWTITIAGVLCGIVVLVGIMYAGWIGHTGTFWTGLRWMQLGALVVLHVVGLLLCTCLQPRGER